MKVTTHHKYIKLDYIKLNYTTGLFESVSTIVTLSAIIGTCLVTHNLTCEHGISLQFGPYTPHIGPTVVLITR